MNTLLKLITVATSTLLLSGCALTSDTLPENYQLNKSATTLKATKPEKIAVNVQDKRNIDDKRMLFHKRNAFYMKMSGNYKITKPLSVVVKNALETGLKQMNYLPTKNANYALNCSIISANNNSSIDGPIHSKIRVSIKLNVQVYNHVTHKRIWQRVLVGYSDELTAWGGDNTIKRVFNNALTNAIRQLQQSKSFVRALK